MGDGKTRLPWPSYTDRGQSEAKYVPEEAHSSIAPSAFLTVEGVPSLP